MYVSFFKFPERCLKNHPSERTTRTPQGSFSYCLKKPNRILTLRRFWHWALTRAGQPKKKSRQTKVGHHSASAAEIIQNPPCLCARETIHCAATTTTDRPQFHIPTLSNRAEKRQTPRRLLNSNPPVTHSVSTVQQKLHHIWQVNLKRDLSSTGSTSGGKNCPYCSKILALHSRRAHR